MKTCRKAKRIFIYGAGKNAEKIYVFLIANNIAINGYIVTDSETNPKTLHKKKVERLDQWRQKKADLVISSMLPKTAGYLAVFENLERRGIKNVFFLSESELRGLGQKKQNICQDFLVNALNHNPYRYEESVPVEVNHFIFSQNADTIKGYNWRISKAYLEKLEGKTIASVFQKSTSIDEFEGVYGKYYPLLSIKGDGTDNECSCKVYMATGAMDIWALGSKIEEWIVPVQAGASESKSLLFTLHDDDGENISQRNRNYSEGTVIYWMWKNAPKSDYIGLCHYRRRLLITKEHIGRFKSAGIDVIVTSPTFVFDSAGAFLEKHTPHTDFVLLREKVRELFPDYLDAVDIFVNARFYPPCNIFLMRWDVFRQYGDFVFPVCLAIDKYYESIGYRRKDRYMGYLLEALLGIFLIRNKENLKIAYTDMIFIKKEQ